MLLMTQKIVIVHWHNIGTKLRTGNVHLSKMSGVAFFWRCDMITIDSSLAHEIVGRTMKIIPFNVNVMDAKGIIIGSGDASRIGELHFGAQVAIAQQHPVEIDSASTRNMHGVKQGVNLPLTVRGQVCGVVGLTGDPDTVRQFGELVRVMAEMILEQAQLIGELQREKRYQEEFVSHLVKQGNTPRADLEAWASRLGVDFLCPRAVVVLVLVEEKLRPDLGLIKLQRCQQNLASQHDRILSAVISPRELVILETFDSSGSGAPKAALARQRLLALDAVLMKDLGTASVLSIGVALTRVEGIALSYQSARKTMRVGQIRNPHERLFSYYDLSLPVLLDGLGSGWQAEQLRLPLQRLDAFDKRSGTLRRTVDVWFARNGHPVATAKALRIHRNTLDYRLRQVSELTGLDLANTDDRLLLYIALQLE
jgi:carbohydrate diacid regulator